MTLCGSVFQVAFNFSNVLCSSLLRNSRQRYSVRKGVLRNFANLLRTPFLLNTSGRLFLFAAHTSVSFWYFLIFNNLSPFCYWLFIIYLLFLWRWFVTFSSLIVLQDVSLSLSLELYAFFIFFWVSVTIF